MLEPGRGNGAAGLIDTHTHLAFDATDQAAAHVQTATEDDLLAQMRQAGRAMLSSGITTTRDLGDRDDQRAAVGPVTRRGRPG